MTSKSICIIRTCVVFYLNILRTVRLFHSNIFNKSLRVGLHADCTGCMSTVVNVESHVTAPYDTSAVFFNRFPDAPGGERSGIPRAGGVVGIVGHAWSSFGMDSLQPRQSICRFLHRSLALLFPSMSCAWLKRLGVLPVLRAPGLAIKLLLSSSLFPWWFRASFSASRASVRRSTQRPLPNPSSGQGAVTAIASCRWVGRSGFYLSAAPCCELQPHLPAQEL